LDAELAIWMTLSGFYFAREGQRIDGFQSAITEPPFCATRRGNFTVHPHGKKKN